MTVPPSHAAPVRTVLFQTPVGRLQDAFPALRAHARVRDLRMPADMGTHSVDRQSDALRDLTRLKPCQPQGVDLIFDLWFHFVPPNKERMAVMTILPA
jgi:hypothetical protein